MRGVQIWCPQDCPLQPPASCTQLVLLPGSYLLAFPRGPSCPKATGTGPGEGWRGGWSHQEPPHLCPCSARLALLPIIHDGKTETQRECIIDPVTVSGWENLYMSLRLTPNLCHQETPPSSRRGPRLSDCPLTLAQVSRGAAKALDWGLPWAQRASTSLWTLASSFCLQTSVSSPPPRPLARPSIPPSSQANAGGRGAAASLPPRGHPASWWGCLRSADHANAGCPPTGLAASCCPGPAGRQHKVSHCSAVPSWRPSCIAL